MMRPTVTVGSMSRTVRRTSGATACRTVHVTGSIESHIPRRITSIRGGYFEICTSLWFGHEDSVDVAVICAEVSLAFAICCQPGWKSHPTMIMKASPDPDALVLNKNHTGRQKSSSLSHQYYDSYDRRLAQGTHKQRQQILQRESVEREPSTQITLRSEVPGDIQDQLRRALCPCIGFTVGVGNDGHVRRHRSILGIQRRYRWLRFSVRPQRQEA